jgi:transglutaminase-like putative cysteine protease
LPANGDGAPTSGAGSAAADGAGGPVDFVDEDVAGPAAQQDQPDEPVLQASDPPSFRADTQTVRDGLLAYHEPFDPSIAPLKRGHVLDQVRADYTLAVSDPSLKVVPINRPSSGGARFTASLLVRFEPGRAVAIPSVAAEQNILSVQVDPPVPVEILRDAADNYFARASSTDLSVAHRVMLSIEAPTSYFNARIAPGITPADVPPSLRPQLPDSVRETAEVVRSRLDLRATDPLERTLERMVGWFRSFESGTLEEPTGDLYLDLALGGRGVCRHRAFAFVVTAQSIGIPARYVYNEAHAFVEVLLPRQGWTRIDLGGDALRLELSNAEAKTLYRTGPDPFPQPLSYLDGYSRLQGDVDGEPADVAPARAQRMDERLLPLTPEALATGDHDKDDGATAGRVGTALTDPMGAMEPTPPSSIAAPWLSPIELTLERHETSGVRGQPLLVEGRADTPRVRIEVYLSPDDEQRGFLVGTAITDERGGFRVQAPVPADTPVGTYRLVVVSPGDDTHAAGRSR